MVKKANTPRTIVYAARHKRGAWSETMINDAKGKRIPNFRSVKTWFQEIFLLRFLYVHKFNTNKAIMIRFAKAAPSNPNKRDK